MDKRARRHWVGFDLGGTKMMAAVFSEEFRILGRRRRKTKGAEGAKAGWSGSSKRFATPWKTAKSPPRHWRASASAARAISTSNKE